MSHTLHRRVRRRAWLLLPTLIALPAIASASRGTTSASRKLQLSIHAEIERSTWDSVFTAEQATRGQTGYKKDCSRCHGESMAGADEAPALTGSAFMSAWNGQTLHELHDRILTSMPTDTPGVYSRQQVADVIAYMLQFNGYPAGASELAKETEALQEIRFLAGKP